MFRASASGLNAGSLYTGLSPEPNQAYTKGLARVRLTRPVSRGSRASSPASHITTSHARAVLVLSSQFVDMCSCQAL